MLLLKERLSSFIEKEKDKQGFYKKLIDENFLLLAFMCHYQQLVLGELLECVLLHIYKDTSKLQSVPIDHDSTLSKEQQYILVALSYYLNDTDIVFQRRKYIVNILERLYLIRNRSIKSYKLVLPCIFYVLGNGFTVILSHDIKTNIKGYVDTLKKCLPDLSTSDKTFLREYTTHVARFINGHVEYTAYFELLNEYFYLYVHPEGCVVTTN